MTPRRLCPFTRLPWEDCYCFELTSTKVKDAVYFCAGHFEECCIYQKNRSSLEPKGQRCQNIATNL